MPTFDLSLLLRSQGLPEAQAGLRGVETQARATSEALDQVMKTSDFTGQSYSQLLAGQNAIEQSLKGQLIPALATTTTTARNADGALLGMSRSLLFVASTGNIAGRGMAGFLANFARFLGPGNELLAGLAIAGLAVNAFWELWERRAKKAEEATKKAIDAILNPLTEKDEERRRLELFAERAKLLDKIATLQRNIQQEETAAPHTTAGPGGTAAFLANMRSDLAELEAKVAQINKNIADATRLETQISEHKAAVEDTERAMTDARTEIEQRAQERQSAADQGHVKAAKLALGFQEAASKMLAEAEAKYKTLGVTVDQIKKNIVDADAEMRRHLARGTRTEAVVEASREDKKKPAKEKVDREDELSHLEDYIALLGEEVDVAGGAQRALLALADVETQLRARIADVIPGTAEWIRLQGELATVLEQEAKAQKNLRDTFNAKPEQQKLRQEAKDAAAALEERKRDMQSAFSSFGQSLESAWEGLWSSFGQKGGMKHAFQNLAKTALAAVGNLFVMIGNVLAPFGALMQSFAAALAANPLLSGPVGIAVGLALIALGSALGAAVSAGTSGQSVSPASSYFGPASTITTLYGGSGGNPVTGLPNPTGPQQPITVHVGPVIGPNDLGAFRSIVDGVNAAARAGYALKSYAVKGA